MVKKKALTARGDLKYRYLVGLNYPGET
jgi:hypothetical protein